MKVQDILTDEGKWAKGHSAYDARSNVCGPTEDRAVCWCLLGALAKAGLWASTENERLMNEITSRFGIDVSTWNDKSSFAEVRALIEELDI